MIEAIVSAGPKVSLTDSPVPVPNADQVLIKVVISGSNPKDWKRPEIFGSHNSGDDIAGIVEAVGENVFEFKKGDDRVAAFHELMTPHGSYAEYAISWQHTVFHLPENTSFEEAATIPLAAMTAAYALYFQMQLPEPWHATTSSIPLLINGAATAVGAFAIKLAQRSNIHPLICVAGSGIPFVQALISPEKGDIIIDYRKGDVTASLKEAIAKLSLKHEDVKHAIECVGNETGYQLLYPVLSCAGGAKLACVSPRQPYNDVPSHVQIFRITVPSVHEDVPPEVERAKAGMKEAARDFAFVWYRYFGRGLMQGWLTGHPFKVVDGGLAGLEKALVDLKAGKVSGFKYVFRIGDTKV